MPSAFHQLHRPAALIMSALLPAALVALPASALAETDTADAFTDATTTGSDAQAGRYPIPREHFLANERAAENAADGISVNATDTADDNEEEPLLSAQAFTDSDDEPLATVQASNTVAVDGSRALAYAKTNFNGKAYVYGGRSLNGVDCAGLVMYSANQTLGTNYDLMYTDAARLYELSKPISKAELKAGDLVFWKGTYGASLNWISHVGFYAGNGKVYMAGDPVGTYSMNSVTNIAGKQAEQLYARIQTSKSAVTLTASRIALVSWMYTSLPLKPYSGTITISNPSMTLTEGTDYTVSYKNNVKLGTATAIIQGKGIFSGKVNRTFQITKRKFSNITMSSSTAKYTGKPIKFFNDLNWSVDNSRVTLRNGTDFTVAYKNNTKIGTATAIVTFKGNFSGKVTKTFKIIKGNNPLNTWSKYTFNTWASNTRGAAVKSKAGVLVSKAGAGKVTYAKKSGSNRLSISGDGRIVVAKGTPRGTYNMTVNIKASGDSNYEAKTVSCPVVVNVKATK